MKLYRSVITLLFCVLSLHLIAQDSPKSLDILKIELIPEQEIIELEYVFATLGMFSYTITNIGKDTCYISGILSTPYQYHVDSADADVFLKVYDDSGEEIDIYEGLSVCWHGRIDDYSIEEVLAYEALASGESTKRKAEFSGYVAKSKLDKQDKIIYCQLIYKHYDEQEFKSNKVKIIIRETRRSYRLKKKFKRQDKRSKP